MRTALFVALALCVAGSGRAARANGRLPTSQFVTVGPGREADLIVLRTTFGLVLGHEGGRRWTWLCEDLFGYGMGVTWDPPVAIGGRGPGGVPVLVGLPDGLARSYDACRAERDRVIGEVFTGDLTTDASGRTVLFVSSDGGFVSNRVYASHDGGRTFTPLGAGVAGVLFETIELAESNHQRVYLTGVTIDPRRYVFYRSDDGGRTLEELPLDLQGGRDAFLSGVDPTNADVLYLRSTLPETDGGGAGMQLLRSDDGGRRWRVVHRTAGPMLGFALSGDGRTVWGGGPDARDRLARSDDGGRTFRRVSPVQVLCLRWHAGALYICANHLFDGFALGRSSDGGESIRPLLAFRDLPGPPTCPAGTTGDDLCRPRWPQVSRTLGVDAGFDAPRGKVMDAGRRTQPPPPGSSGWCSTRPRAPRGRAGTYLALALTLAPVVRARRRRALAAAAHTQGPGDAV